MKKVSVFMLFCLVVSFEANSPIFAEKKDAVATVISSSPNIETSNPDEKQAIEVLEITLPDGTKQKGFIQNSVFIPLAVQPSEETSSAPQSEPPEMDVTISTIPLRSRIRKTYSGYKIVLTNNSPNPVNLLNGQVVNGVDGQGAALGAQKSSAAAIGTTLGAGLVTGIFTLGISTLASWVASPIIYGVNKHANNKTIAEGVAFSNQVPTGVLNNGDTAEFTTLVPVGQKPKVKFSVKEMESAEVFTVSR